MATTERALQATDTVLEVPTPAESGLLDLNAFRGLGDGDEDLGTPSTIPVKKPAKTTFFQVHPGAAYRLFRVPVIQEEGSNDFYLLDPKLEIPDDIAALVNRVTLVICVTSRDSLFIWPIKGSDSSWANSARKVASQASKEWVRIAADMDAGGYRVFAAPEPLKSKEPKYPAMTPEKIFTIAFEGKHITSLEDPFIRRLRGLDI